MQMWLAALCLSLFSLLSPASAWSLSSAWSSVSSAVSSFVDNNLLPQSTAGCPPTGFDALPTLNVSSYISAPWYVQLQQPISYQKEDTLYCVKAEYKNLSANPLDGLLVLNSARKGGVNGRAMGTSDSGWFKLTASVPDRSRPSKLAVGPQLWGWNTPLSLRGDYWIVAAGPEVNGPYTWAIISGGVPKVASNGACKTGSTWPLVAASQTNGIGLWFFTRDVVASAVMIETMTKKATSLGFDTSVLKVVQQAGCDYPDISPPPPSPPPLPPGVKPVVVIQKRNSKLFMRRH